MKKVSKFLALFLAGVFTVGAMGNYSGNSVTAHAYENKFYKASALAANGGDTGLKTIADDTSDYYAVDLASDGALVINITGYKIADSDIIIYNSSDLENCITFDYFMNADDETKIYKYPLSAGKYVVQFKLNNPMKSEKYSKYQIRTKFESYGKNTPKDSYNSPKSLALNTNYYDSITLNDDKDWYRFTLTEETYCQMKMTAIGQYVDGNILDADLQTSYGFFTCFCHENEEVTKYVDYYLPAGTYYLRIKKGGGCAKYNFVLSSKKVDNSPVSKVKAQAGGKAVVSFKRNDDASGYQIRYSTDKKFRKKVKTKNFTRENTISRGKNLEYKLTKLKKRKTYYVQVRSYIEKKGTKYFSDWSKAKKVRTK